MKVIMLPDRHGVEESVGRQMEMILKYELEPETSVIVHEPLPNSYLIAAGSFSDERKSLAEFWNYIRLEEHWGPSRHYEELYAFLSAERYYLWPLDHSLEERVNLAKRFQDLVIKYRKGRKREREDLSREFDALKREISFERERRFCQEIDGLKYAFETAVVITHPAHIGRCVSYLRDTQGYQVEIDEADPTLAKELSEEENNLQLGFAKEEKILSMEVPPLVPMVVLAWETLKFE